jgi:deoxyribose-phosphate aldolase
VVGSSDHSFILKKMKDEEILRCIDHTLLKMSASWEEIQTLCDEAVRFNTASVCIPPCYVKPVRDEYKDKLNICTVVGFPLGYNVTAAKIAETQIALADGADEIDMVINAAGIKNDNYDFILEEIMYIRKICGKHILKVIIETCYLTEEEKIQMCAVVTDAGADFIKTSTGFGTAGATLMDIELFKKHIGPNVEIKAAGGIKTREDLVAFINAGVSRIGSSSAVKLLCGGAVSGY